MVYTWAHAVGLIAESMPGVRACPGLRNPVGQLIEEYLQAAERPVPVDREKRPSMILPKAFAQVGLSLYQPEDERRLPGVRSLSASDDAVRFLPDRGPILTLPGGLALPVETGAAPLLISRIDLANRGSEWRKARGAGPATVFSRMLLEGLGASPAREREDGKPHVYPVPVAEIVEDWLQWKIGGYKPSGEFTGAAIQAAVTEINAYSVLYERNQWLAGYRPLKISAPKGYGRRAALEFSARLPAGNNVGARLNQLILRKLGVRDGRAYRAYIWICIEMDRVAAHRGRLPRPERLKVRRDPQGRVLDARGQVVLGKGGVPVRSNYHPKAVLTGEVESNPAAAKYRSYDRYELLRFVFPEEYLANSEHHRHVGRDWARAKKAFALIEELGGCVIERSGGGRDGLPWKLLPPSSAEVLDVEAVPMD